MTPAEPTRQKRQKPARSPCCLHEAEIATLLSNMTNTLQLLEAMRREFRNEEGNAHATELKLERQITLMEALRENLLNGKQAEAAHIAHIDEKLVELEHLCLQVKDLVMAKLDASAVKSQIDTQMMICSERLAGCIGEYLAERWKRTWAWLKPLLIVVGVTAAIVVLLLVNHNDSLLDRLFKWIM